MGAGQVLEDDAAAPFAHRGPIEIRGWSLHHAVSSVAVSPAVSRSSGIVAFTPSDCLARPVASCS